MLKIKRSQFNFEYFHAIETWHRLHEGDCHINLQLNYYSSTNIDTTSYAIKIRTHNDISISNFIFRKQNIKCFKDKTLI